LSIISPLGPASGTRNDNIRGFTQNKASHIVGNSFGRRHNSTVEGIQINGKIRATSNLKPKKLDLNIETLIVNPLDISLATARKTGHKTTKTV
jgi:hypothetical protein